MKKSEIISAWRSHSTLFRQSGNNFNGIIEAIKDVIRNEEQAVPYSTKIWFCSISSAPELTAEGRVSGSLLKVINEARVLKSIPPGSQKLNRWM
tara:strand:+ start:2745 stop:3026 length:282 start_codon:yes stop_codon:yes gene_type:complete